MSDREEEKREYETEDVRISPILWSGVILAGVIVVSVVAMMVMFGVLYQDREAAIESVGPMFALQEKPRGPILQVDPPQELIDVRQQDGETADSYGWVHRESQIVRIPVQRAMNLVVQRGIK